MNCFCVFTYARIETAAATSHFLVYKTQRVSNSTSLVSSPKQLLPNLLYSNMNSFTLPMLNVAAVKKYLELNFLWKCLILRGPWFSILLLLVVFSTNNQIILGIQRAFVAHPQESVPIQYSTFHTHIICISYINNKNCKSLIHKFNLYLWQIAI